MNGASSDGGSPGSRARHFGARVVAYAVGVLLIGVSVVYGVSEQALERRYAVAVQSAGGLEIPVDPALVERGRHLVTVVAQCAYCHGPDLAGRALADDPWIGRLSASNLTRGEGGIGARFTDADWAAALRRGVNPAGRSLLLMPSAHLARLSERDLSAVVAYVRQVPAVDRVLPERRAGWLTRLVVAVGLAPDLISAEQVSGLAPVVREIPSAATSEYGEYLVALGGCRVCHRGDLAGGLHPLSLPGEPVPPDITPRGSLGRWSERDFVRAMREGRTPEGRVLDREFMPWPAFAGLSETEVEAIWQYLIGMESIPVPAAPEATRLARGAGSGARG